MTLNMDEFRVMDLKPSLAVTMDPFFSSTTRGSGLKRGLNLFFFGCLTSNVSSGLTLLGFTPSFKSAYSLIFDFCSASLSAIVFRVSCRVSCLAGAGDTSGRVILSFREVAKLNSVEGGDHCRSSTRQGFLALQI